MGTIGEDLVQTGTGQQAAARPRMPGPRAS
jgi:hypothetical protein